jgi:hypothetical protein
VKKVYFKAYIAISTEQLWLNTETNAYEGTDPDTYQDHGVIETLRATTLDDLKNKISRQFFDLDKPIGADVQIFENRIEMSYQGENDYRLPKKEQIPFIENLTIIIVKIEETEIDLSTETLFKKIGA